MFKRKPEATRTPLKVLTGEELEGVTGGAEMITAVFAYGGLTLVVSATKNEYSMVLTGTKKKS